MLGAQSHHQPIAPLFLLKGESHMMGNSLKSTTWIYQWPRTSQTHLGLNAHVHMDRAIILEEKGTADRPWPPLPSVGAHHLESLRRYGRLTIICRFHTSPMTFPSCACRAFLLWRK